MALLVLVGDLLSRLFYGWEIKEKKETFHAELVLVSSEENVEAK